MSVAVRTCAVPGIALVAAGAIAAAPLTLRPDALPTLAVPVALAALPSWLQWVDDGTDLLAAQIAAIANGIQNELEDPVPIATTVIRNQVINGQDLGGALVTSAQVVLTGLIRVPDLLLNAVFDAIANPLGIPLILAGLVADVVNTLTAAITPLGAALTGLVSTTTTRAFGAVSAVVANAGPIGAALLGVPVAIGTAIVNAAAAVVGSVLTLNPLNVVGAVGDGLVAIEAASFNSVAAVAGAVGDLRSDVRTALAYPLPAATVAPPRAAAAVAVGTEPVAPVGVPAIPERTARGVAAPRADAPRADRRQAPAERSRGR